MLLRQYLDTNKQKIPLITFHRLVEMELMKVFLKWTLGFSFLFLFATSPKKIHIYYTDAGGGHKATAFALKEGLTARYPESQIELIKTSEHVGNFLENARFKGLEKIYTQNLGSPIGRLFNRLYGDFIICPITQTLEYLSERQMARLKNDHPLVAFLKQEKPDMIISTASFINRHLKTGIEYADINAPFIVVMSDFDEAQKVMWTNPKDGTHYIIRAGATLKNEISPKYLYPISGMCVRCAFEPLEYKNYKVFEDLNLKIVKPTALVTFGGYGSQEMKEILQFFNNNSNLQGIFICGTNEKLKEDLTKMANFNSKILGFVENMHEYMQACHVLIGKPGPGIVSEAVITRLPMFLKSGADLMKQEEGVLSWVLDRRFGDEWKTFDDFQKNYGKILMQLPRFKKNLERHPGKNPTLEAVDHIDKIYQELQPEIPQARVANYTFY